MINFLKSITVFMNISGISLFPLLYLILDYQKIPAKITHETIHINNKNYL
jgi:hypothetical protein